MFNYVNSPLHAFIQVHNTLLSCEYCGQSHCSVTSTVSHPHWCLWDIRLTTTLYV
uniref:Phorbol-ester/DAG-type domain-containing protein n=1 Tax=Heterorhabditis bacteriophora TaxID=37862 RepID=A0A1I7XEJ2_HETBA